ncbi:DUF3592 domain-containing protein [Brevundimonas sp. 2R-24]|uniref:DUF3592 domain-containing protein n=1 Tax=Peiella sedimenti TaxID=3061083 RepID=A0ABT8SJH2_9CAUL|nr:DUF3592 domain-containing protein [Caulobacteraceae bacterium XZ-24]
MAGFVILITLALVALVWVLHFRAVKRAGLASTWPRTVGRVTRSEVIEEEDTDSYGDRSSAYISKLAYEYEVGGRTYTGERVGLGATPRWSLRKKAEAVISRFPVGAQPQVIYNPDDPAEACLDAKKPGVGMPIFWTVVLLFLGFVFLGVWAE